MNRDNDQDDLIFHFDQPTPKDGRRSLADEDMKIAPGSGRMSDQNNRRPASKRSPGPPFDDFEEPVTKKTKKAESKLTRFTKSLFLICLYMGIAVFLAYFALMSASDLLGLGQTDQQREVIIPDTAAGSVGKVAKILDESGVITQRITFELYAAFKGRGDQFEAGTYVLNDKWGYDQLMNHIGKGGSSTQDIVTLTFIEGYSQRQIGEMLEEAKVCTATDFYKALEDGSYNYQFTEMIPEEPLRFRKMEGYLFPDTYDFYVDMKPEEVVKKFFDNFDSKMTNEKLAKIRNLPNGLGELDNLVTLAALIQKEASTLEEMQMVSSVFHNRLNNSSLYPYLQSDATDNYIRDSIRYFMTENNQQIYDAYDTKKVVGLPVGPICNPGMDAIDAAMSPAESEYFYFVSDNAGNYYYGKTDAEHEANKRKVKDANAKLEKEKAAAAKEETGK